MVEGPGCKLKGEKMRAKILKQRLVRVAGNAIDKRPKSAPALTPYHGLLQQQVMDVRTLGKELFIVFGGEDSGGGGGGGSCLRVHFLMAGFVRYNNQSDDPDESARKKTPEQPRLLLELDRDTVSLYQCSVEVRDSSQCIERWEKMINLDICWPDFDAQRACQVILDERNQKRIVADVIMDQEILPGVGNIIKNEACFDAGINPLARIEELTPAHIARLVKMCRDFSAVFYNCRKTGKPLHKHYKIYRFSKCKQCEGKVMKCKPGEYLRGTFICTACQTNRLEAGPLKNSLLGWATSVSSIPWNCSSCTLENKPGSLTCAACGTSRQKRKSTADQDSESKKIRVEPVSKSAESSLPPLGLQLGQSAALKATTQQPPSRRAGLNSTAAATADVATRAAEPVPPPVCQKHGAPCAKKTVVKAGPNKGRLFYACSLPQAKSCEHFAWADLHHPKCRHGGQTVLREVTQLNANNGRQFFVCGRARGQQCEFFQWNT